LFSRVMFFLLFFGLPRARPFPFDPRYKMVNGGDLWIDWVRTLWVILILSSTTQNLPTMTIWPSHLLFFFFFFFLSLFFFCFFSLEVMFVSCFGRFQVPPTLSCLHSLCCRHWTRSLRSRKTKNEAFVCLFGFRNVIFFFLSPMSTPSLSGSLHIKWWSNDSL